MIKLLIRLFKVIKKGLRWIGKQKQRFDNWSEQYLMIRKLGTVGLLLGAMLFLFIQAKLAPQQSRWPDTELNVAEPLGQNSTATISMLSKKYNPKQKFMVLNFKVEQSGSQILDPANIKLSAQTIGKRTAKYTVLPLANNHFVMLLEDLKPGYVAVQVTAKNTQKNTQNLPADVVSTDDVSSSSSSSNDKQNGGVGSTTFKFIVNEKKGLEDTKLVKQSQVSYAKDSLQKSITSEHKRIKELQNNIKAYQKQQEADQAVIRNAEENKQYQVQNDETKSLITNAKSDYQTQEGNIKTANKLIDKAEKQIKLYQKQIEAIQTGKYHFDSPVRTGEVKYKKVKK